MLEDLVEEHKDTKLILNNSPSESPLFHKVNSYVRFAARATLRLTGDAMIAFMGYSSFQDPKNAAKYMLVGALSCATLYFVEDLIHIRNRWTDPLRMHRDYLEEIREKRTKQKYRP